jgi:hypothetical protein
MDQTHSYIGRRFEKIYNNYIETKFTIASTDVEPFFRHAVQYAMVDVQRDITFHIDFNANLLTRIKDPRGMKSRSE